MFKTMLICSDGSGNALKAAQKGIAMAKEQNACVLLLNIESAGMQNYTVPWQLEVGSAVTVPQITAQQEANQDKVKMLCEQTGVRYRYRQECGHAAEQIVRVAEEEDVDLIVMGSRGLSEWKALLLGSVSSHVLHHAPCSVLIVR